MSKKKPRPRRRKPAKSDKPNKPYGLTSPCDSCPFRNDIRPFLTKRRVIEIEKSLVRSEFPCHKTVDYDNANEHTGEITDPGEGAKHCAGALILKEKLGETSQMMRICERVGLYDPTKLNMDAPVFDTWEEMFDAQPR